MLNYFKYKHLAYWDLLCNCNNRNFLEDKLIKKYANRSTYITMIDVDYFKNVNDILGHLAGDKILHSLVDILNSEANIKYICRYGGDEFFMVIVGCDRLDVLTKSLDLLRSVAKLKINRVRNQELYLTISVGVTMLNNKIDSPSEFISSVDENLYCAKNNGKACVAFEKKIYR